MNRTKKKKACTPINSSKTNQVVKSIGSQPNNTSTQANQPTISLCMIVKNEEKHLAGCLESVRDLVDEMVIVDTGSTDATIQIAESFGAQIYHFDWINDFAAARNQSLIHATKDWILYLDADERIEAAHHAAIRKAVQNKIKAGLFYIQITGQNGVGETSRLMTHTYPRLFKNVPGLQFEGAVHEQIIPSCKRLGILADYCDAVITHLGYALEAEDEQRKYQRNLDLLMSQLKQTPNQFFLHFNMGRTYVGLKQYDKGLESLRHAVTLNDSSASPHLKANAHLVIGQLLYRIKQDAEGAISASEAALRFDPELLPAKRLMAEAYFAKGQFSEAAKCFEQTIKLSQVERKSRDLCDETVVDVDALYESLGMSQVKTGNYAEAARNLKKALELNGNRMECYLHLGEALLKQGQYQGAFDSLKRYLGDGNEQAQRLKALYGCSVASLKLGDSQEAEHYLRESQALAPDLLSATTDLVDLLRKENRQEDALCYLRSLPNNLASSIQVLKLECTLLGELGQGRELLQACKQLLQVEGESAFVMTQMGKGFEQAEQGEKALQCYERAVSLDSEYAPAWEAIGTYCLTTGNYSMALECLQMAQNLGLKSSDLYNLLGLASSATGDKASAQRYFKQTLVVNPSDQFAAGQLRSLAATA